MEHYAEITARMSIESVRLQSLANGIAADIAVKPASSEAQVIPIHSQGARQSLPFAHNTGSSACLRPCACRRALPYPADCPA